MQRNVTPFSQPTSVVYHTDDPKSELLDILREQVSPILLPRYDIIDTALTVESEQQLARVNQVRGEGLKTVPQITMLVVHSESGEDELFTLLHNNAHINISRLFNEESNRDFANDDMTIVRGVVGSYPAAFFSIEEDQVKEFVAQFSTLKSESDYVKLLDNFAIRRSAESSGH